MKCDCCNKDYNEDNFENFRINEFNGFFHSSEPINVCKECIRNNNIFKITSKGDFFKFKGNLYYDGYGIGVFEQIYNTEQIDRIFNREYYSILDMLDDK